MKIHEYQGKQLLRAAGVAVPRGVMVQSVDAAVAAYEELGGELAVLKSQIHAGGRGKGRFLEEPDQPGVVLVRSADEIRANAERMLGKTLVTIQTGEQGKTVKTLFVEEGLDIACELYLGIVVDREAGGPVLITSTEGGMAIEEVAAETPEKIAHAPIDIDEGLSVDQARAAGQQLGLEGVALEQAETFLPALCRFFIDNDCSLTEVNPLVVTGSGELVCLDSKVSFDDNALFRHEGREELRDLDEEDPAEVRADEAGLSYVNLDGNIGCLVNGAGLAMSTMDLIKLHGGEPANFLDVGGSADVEAVTEAFRIILGDDSVQAVLVNIFGGIMKCDTIVEALLAAYENVGISIPLVVRLEGTNVERAREMLAESGREILSATDLTDAAHKIVGTLGA